MPVGKGSPAGETEDRRRVMAECPYAERIRNFYEMFSERGIEGATEFLSEDRFTRASVP